MSEETFSVTDHRPWTIRDSFAKAAMQSIASTNDASEEGIARLAYKMADAMMKERENRNP